MDFAVYGNQRLYDMTIELSMLLPWFLGYVYYETSRGSGYHTNICICGNRDGSFTEH